MQVRKKVYLNNTVIKIFILFLVLLIAQNTINSNTLKKNNQVMKQSIQSISNGEDIVLLNEIVPFKWDSIYTFAPYYPKSSAYKTIGYNIAKHVKEGVSEDFFQMIFVKNGKVVCNLNGSTYKQGYSFYFDWDKSNDGVLTITKEENRKMRISKIENIVVFEEEL